MYLKGVLMLISILIDKFKKYFLFDSYKIIV